MSQQRKYQQGKLENYDPDRHKLNDDFLLKSNYGPDFDVRRKNARDVGGSAEPASPSHPGLHKGKGPKDYRRSDERIMEDINDRLCDNPYLDASEIDVSLSEGNVVLSGSVEGRESKRLAEDIVESVTGVKNVENRLRVSVHGV